MKQAVKPIGTPKDATKASILLEELSKLKDARDKTKANNAKYVERHPELRTIMDEFVTATIAEKPNDIIKFGAKWFASLRAGGMGFSPLILTGPGGCGKTTLTKMLLEKYPGLFAVPMESTNRVRKADEFEGEDYYFVQKSDWDSMVEGGAFVYTRQVYQNEYGFTIDAIEEIVDKKKICLIDCDLETHESYRESPLDCKYFFICPPSLDTLEERLVKSQKYSAAQVSEIAEAAVEQIAAGTEEGTFDAVITNETLKKTFYDLIMAIMSWYTNADIDPPKQLDEASMDSESKSGGNSSGTNSNSKASKK